MSVNYFNSKHTGAEIEYILDNAITQEVFNDAIGSVSSLPVGGSSGQYLVKNSASDGDATWKDLPSLNYLPLTGGVMSGAGAKIFYANGTYTSSIGGMYDTGAGIQIRENGLVGNSQTDFGYAPTLGLHWGGIVAVSMSLGSDGVIYFKNNSGNGATLNAGKVYGAVWNDYAEYRNQEQEIEPGYCVRSDDYGRVSKTEEMYAACDGIVSDTFGFAIGETDDCKTPLAVAGRVLAYPAGSPKDYHAGDTVCAGPGGLVYKMSREEIVQWPDRIVGIVSEIPNYDTWGTSNVKVNNRIWIKVK